MELIFAIVGFVAMFVLFVIGPAVIARRRRE